VQIHSGAKLEKIKQKQKHLFGQEYEIINGLAYPTEAVLNQSAAAAETTDESGQIAQAAPGTLPPTKNISNFIGTLKGLY
jgi:hypothetical protein